MVSHESKGLHDASQRPDAGRKLTDHPEGRVLQEAHRVMELAIPIVME
jgi:hypothetical protein